jgi:hypothetical protein
MIIHSQHSKGTALGNNLLTQVTAHFYFSAPFEFFLQLFFRI